MVDSKSDSGGDGDDGGGGDDDDDDVDILCQLSYIVSSDEMTIHLFRSWKLSIRKPITSSTPGASP